MKRWTGICCLLPDGIHRVGEKTKVTLDINLNMEGKCHGTIC